MGGSATGRDHYLFGFSTGFATQALVLTCASSPVAKDDCKGSGWRDFGVFANQGDCVSYLATGGRGGRRA